MTTGARLVEISGLASATAGDHLVAASPTPGTAGARLVARSGLPSGTAMQHLLAGAIALAMARLVTRSPMVALGRMM